MTTSSSQAAAMEGAVHPRRSFNAPNGACNGGARLDPARARKSLNQ